MLPAVACWGATFCSFWGIGEGGTAFPRESWSRGGGPCGPRYARGQRPLCTPLVGAQLPRPQRAGAPPRAPGDFRFTTKVTKGVPGLCPWTPLGGHYHPPNGARAVPPRKGLSLQPRPICHFEFVGESVFFSPSVSARAHLLVSGRGAAGGRTKGSCCFCAG